MNAFFIDIAVKQGWLDEDQILLIEQALQENPKFWEMIEAARTAK